MNDIISIWIANDGELFSTWMRSCECMFLQLSTDFLAKLFVEMAFPCSVGSVDRRTTITAEWWRWHLKKKKDFKLLAAAMNWFCFVFWQLKIIHLLAWTFRTANFYFDINKGNREIVVCNFCQPTGNEFMAFYGMHCLWFLPSTDYHQQLTTEKVSTRT